MTMMTKKNFARNNWAKKSNSHAGGPAGLLMAPAGLAVGVGGE